MYRSLLTLGRHLGADARHRGTRFMATRSGLKDERTQQLMKDIEKLERQLESTHKKASQPQADALDTASLEAIYSELAAKPTRVQTHIGPDYLENLRVKFLDTRSLLPQQAAPASLASGAIEPIETPVDEPKEAIETQQQQDAALATHDESNLDAANVSTKDYEMLIYANALAARPEQAEQALQLMVERQVAPTTRCYNHLMDAYANANDTQAAIDVFRRLHDQGLTPDVYSYASVIKALAQASRLDDAFVVLEQMKRHALVPTQPIFANLISQCLKAHQIDRAWDTFDAMRLSYHQPDEVTFTLMLHACAKNGEVERALNLFEEMTSLQLYPTDVTFNVLIHACAKRPDYYDDAFALLRQMQDAHGFDPDLVTYNTLLGACARKADLPRARTILRHLLEHSTFQPDAYTLTNMFWAYANYSPPGGQRRHGSTKDASDASEDTAALTNSSLDVLLPTNVPSRRATVVAEARGLFAYFEQMEKSMVTTSLLTAYLNTHVMQRQPAKDCLFIYNDLFAKHNCTALPTTYAVMLRSCYNHQDAETAWRIWDDYQQFLEKRAIDNAQQHNVSESEAKQQAVQRQRQQVIEGWTVEHQRKIVLQMASVLARCNQVSRAVQLLQSHFGPGSAFKRLNMKDVATIYNKAVQIEDKDSRRQLDRLAKKHKTQPTSSTYRRVNS